MIVKPIFYDNILFGELAPWQKDNFSETRFRDILNNQVRVNKDNPQKFFIALLNSLKDYSIRIKVIHLPNAERIADLAKFAELQSGFDSLCPPPYFNKASEFYRYLITNETNRILCAIANNVRKSKTTIDSTYQVSSLLNNLEYTIEQVSQKSCTTKVCTYILDSLKITLFRLYEQIKVMFPEYTGTDFLSEGELIHQLFPDFEKEKSTQSTISFKIQAFLNTKKSQKIAVVISKPEISASQEMVYNSFTYIYLATRPDYLNNLYDSLKSHNFIPRNTSLPDFKKIFTGDRIMKPVIWAGNISELHYFIKLIHNINKSVSNLKQHQWEVACKCFVKPDGTNFDRTRLKDQKKPKLTAVLLEKVAGQLK